ncbi:MAG: hypothetical protein AABW91_01855 [Nanoarchaeota archaeon]
MESEHKIVDKVKISLYIKKLKEYGYDNIEATEHTFFRLSQKQRKIYTENVLKDIIWNNEIFEVGIQSNGNYSIIYRCKFSDKNRKGKIILDFSTNKVYIVTFYILSEVQEKLVENGKKS